MQPVRFAPRAQIHASALLAHKDETMQLIHRIAAAVLSLSLATTAWSDEASSVDELLDRAVKSDEAGDHEQAIQLASHAIAKDPTAASAYYIRGRAHFRAARMPQSVADFDKYIELRPSVSARQWERGIACFYAGQLEAGAKQFEAYQQFDGHDVENSVWRFLCMVPQVGVERAQAVMLPIENDRRVPMMQVYEMYRGNLKPYQVLAAARAGDPEPEVLAGRLFYANLYIGLWHDANGSKELAQQHLKLAADEKLRSNPRINRYMWDVARIHKAHLHRQGEREK